MRAAILSDIHGNAIALDAVLSDIASAGGVDEYWILEVTWLHWGRTP